MHKNLIKNITALLKGHLTVLKYAFEKRVTLEYPEVKNNPNNRFRGKIELVRDENGNLLCTGCGLCQKVCPCKDLIKIERKETESGKVLIYETDFSQCIFCGNCVEFCPSKALKFSKEYELATDDKHKLRKVEQ